jgi:hypothetical protein
LILSHQNQFYSFIQLFKTQFPLILTSSSTSLFISSFYLSLCRKILFLFCRNVLYTEC